MMTRSEPILPARDLPATLAFYRDVLGGEGEWSYGDPAGFGGVRLDGKQLLFELRPDLDYPLRGHTHMLFAENLEAWHDRHVAAGAPIIDPIADRPWGLREYAVEDPNGVRLRFWGLPQYQKPPEATDAMPGSIRIEPRTPTAAEYQALRQAVDWPQITDHQVWLETTRYGVVAVDSATDQTVGMARAVGDAHAWVSVWDVVVRPDYQSKRIGSALMDNLLQQIRQSSPSGTKVFLFTFHHRFYERLGFEQQGCSVVTL
ncbi:MAG: GNAT family N-acetyltransferase [Planctomycetota bacterium]